MTENSNTAASNGNAEELLNRIWHKVQNDSRRGHLELFLAVILSLASLGSAWCGYQNSRWSGRQNSLRAEAAAAELKASEANIVAIQERTFDGIEIIAYWTELRQNHLDEAQLIFERMRPELKTAVNASLADGILQNPSVPGPLQRSEYVLPEQLQAKELRTQAKKLNDESRAAGQISDSYVSLALMLTSVLFFGGITGTFDSRLVRNGLGAIALLLFVATLALLSRLPVSMG